MTEFNAHILCIIYMYGLNPERIDRPAHLAALYRLYTSFNHVVLPEFCKSSGRGIFIRFWAIRIGFYWVYDAAFFCYFAENCHGIFIFILRDHFFLYLEWKNCEIYDQWPHTDFNLIYFTANRNIIHSPRILWLDWLGLFEL